MGKSYDNNAIDELYFAEMIPIVLKLGVSIMASGNDNVQERFMSKIKSSIHDPNDPRGDFIRALCFIIRKTLGIYKLFIRGRRPGYEIPRTNFSCIFDSLPNLKVVSALLTKIEKFQNGSLKILF